LTKEQVDEYNKISGSIGAELIGKHKLSKWKSLKGNLQNTLVYNVIK
jgi:hypothetical protein